MAKQSFRSTTRYEDQRARAKKSREKKTTKNRGQPVMQYVGRPAGNSLAVTERKYFDVEYSAAIPAATADWTGTEADPGTLLTLIAPQLGTAFNNRVGRKIEVLSIKMRCQITCAAQANQTGVDATSVCRIIVYQDKQTNATQAQGEDVISSGAGSQAINMYQNPANFGRFKVMKDKRYILNTQTISWDGTNMEQAGVGKTFQYNFNFSRKPITIHFNAGNTGTYADIVDNSFHVIAACQDAGLVPTLSYKARVVFVDP